MKRTVGIMALMLGLASSASAQVELMFHYSDGNWSHYTVMDRTKKLYWMDDDSNTCFEIKNYKKTGNTENFTLEAKEKGMGMDSCPVTTTVDASGHTATIHYKEPLFFGGKKFEIKTTLPDDPREQERLTRYFNQLAGYPVDEGSATNGVSVTDGVSAAPAAPSAPQNPVDKAKGTAKEAVGKVKGLFKKK